MKLNRREAIALGLGGLAVEFAVERDNAAERRFRVGLERAVIGLEQRGARGERG